MHMGVIKRLEDVPDGYRFEDRAATYRDRDVWGEWVAAEKADLGDRTTQRIKRVERTWKAHMAEKGRHHALATLKDVETHLDGLTDGRQITTVFKWYCRYLQAFYEWLWHHADHIHCYSPVLMAASMGGVAAECWTARIERKTTATYSSTVPQRTPRRRTNGV